MSLSPEILPVLVQAVSAIIEENADEVTDLDKVLGDGDHVTNLQRGLEALAQQSDELAQMEWNQALQKTGMILLSTMGGASGSLMGTLFLSMSKAMKGRKTLDSQTFAEIFSEAVEAVKKRGKAEAGEKTMLDVLIPVAAGMESAAQSAPEWSEYLAQIIEIAEKGMESTRDMLATKGRASYLGEKSLGHIDAGARTSQLMIKAIAEALQQKQ